MKFRNNIFFCAAILIVLLQIGCKSASTTSTPNTTITTSPKTGSSFTFANTSRDTNGVVNFSDTSTQTIIQEDLSFGGVTDAIKVSDYGGPNSGDTSYLRFTTDGDMQLYDLLGENGFSLQWITLPFTTHNPGHLDHDTIIALSKTTEYDTASATIKFERTENVMINGATVACSVISVTAKSSLLLIDNTTHTSSSSNFLLVAEFSFAPTIGWITHHKDITNIMSNFPNDKDEAILFDYTLK